MAQGLPRQRATTGSDRDHVTQLPLPDLRIVIPVLFLFLTLLTLLVAPLSAQSRGEVQVAARVVGTEPSRQALALAVQPGTQPRRSALATVRVNSGGTGSGQRGTGSEGISVATERRLVSIDFLRN